MPPSSLKMKQKGNPNRYSRRKGSRKNLAVEFQFLKSQNNFNSSFNSFYRYGVVFQISVAETDKEFVSVLTSELGLTKMELIGYRRNLFKAKLCEKGNVLQKVDKQRSILTFIFVVGSPKVKILLSNSYGRFHTVKIDFQIF